MPSSSNVRLSNRDQENVRQVISNVSSSKDVKPRPPTLNGKPKEFHPKDLKPKKFLPEDVQPKKFPPEDIRNKKLTPSDIKSRKFPPGDPRFKQFPPKDLKLKQFAPTDVHRKELPSLDVQRKEFLPRDKKKTTIGSKRRILDDDSEYDSEMDDFIDDDEPEDDYSKYISEIFGYDKSRYRDVDDDVDNMESTDYDDYLGWRAAQM
ncbi:hypothetical protein NQ314_000066 [Rhamnusium bicolor]|uniref:Protein SPT2 homolog n=1 Tax=Rhamnusium bicolor TaxID=1586634 RepID=A0AAV8ZWF1_9CUCU|nr:hypothetical protein NQ314_000066 [Rhamnusium bicolor]